MHRHVIEVARRRPSAAAASSRGSAWRRPATSILGSAASISSAERSTSGPHLARRARADLVPAPVLVADAPEPHAERLGLCRWPCASRRKGPGCALQYSTHCCISSGVPLPALVQMYGSQPTSRHHSTNSSVPNVLGSSTPQTGSRNGLAVGPDAVFPVIPAGEAAARPAHDGKLQFLQRRDHVLAKAPFVRQGRAGIEHAAVDLPAEVLEEAAEDHRAVGDRKVRRYRCVTRALVLSAGPSSDSTSATSSYQAWPVDVPQPPNRQLISTWVVLPVWKTVETRVQSRCSRHRGVRTCCRFWMFSRPPTAPRTRLVLIHPESR